METTVDNNLLHSTADNFSFLLATRSTSGHTAHTQRILSSRPTETGLRPVFSLSIFRQESTGSLPAFIHYPKQCGSSFESHQPNPSTNLSPQQCRSSLLIQVHTRSDN